MRVAPDTGSLTAKSIASRSRVSRRCRSRAPTIEPDHLSSTSLRDRQISIFLPICGSLSLPLFAWFASLHGEGWVYLFAQGAVHLVSFIPLSLMKAVHSSLSGHAACLPQKHTA